MHEVNEMMPKKLPRSHSYILRFWQEDGGADWRFMLENPHSGEKRGFGSCEELTVFLEAELAGARGERGT